MTNSNKSEGDPNFLENIAGMLTKFTGSSAAFVGSLLIILVWAVTGWIFGFSDEWQLIINTATNIITFMMVFVIQRSQNKDSEAIHLKLNELIASTQGASNRLIDAEDMSEKELDLLKRHFEMLARLYKNDLDIFKSYSIEEAERKHSQKIKFVKQNRNIS